MSRLQEPKTGDLQLKIRSKEIDQGHLSSYKRKPTLQTLLLRNPHLLQITVKRFPALNKQTTGLIPLKIEKFACSRVRSVIDNLLNVAIQVLIHRNIVKVT